MNVKTEIWCGHEIRFVENESCEWWAVAKDVAEALGYRDAHEMSKMLDCCDLDKTVINMNPHNVSTSDKQGISSPNRKVLIISELGIYDAIFNSRRLEAKDFKKWVFDVIKTLRQKSGLEGFQIFRMMDKEHQKEAMKFLDEGLGKAYDVDYFNTNLK